MNLPTCVRENVSDVRYGSGGTHEVEERDGESDRKEDNDEEGDGAGEGVGRGTQKEGKRESEGSFRLGGFGEGRRRGRRNGFVGGDEGSSGRI